MDPTTNLMTLGILFNQLKKKGNAEKRTHLNVLSPIALSYRWLPISLYPNPVLQLLQLPVSHKAQRRATCPHPLLIGWLKGNPRKHMILRGSYLTC